MNVSAHTRYITTYFGELIKLARKENHITINELSERLGVPLSKVNDIESGDYTIDIGTYLEACLILKIPVLGGDEKNAHNLSTMLGYINTFAPKIQTQRELDDNF